MALLRSLLRTCSPWFKGPLLSILLFPAMPNDGAQAQHPPRLLFLLRGVAILHVIDWMHINILLLLSEVTSVFNAACSIFSKCVSLLTFQFQILKCEITWQWTRSIFYPIFRCTIGYITSKRHSASENNVEQHILTNFTSQSIFKKIPRASSKQDNRSYLTNSTVSSCSVKYCQKYSIVFWTWLTLRS